MLEFSPPELVFDDVVLNKTYTQKVVITNSLKATVEAVIKPGSAERYTVCPCEVLLKPGESIAVEVKLRITRYAHKQRALEAGQRDVIHIRTPYFDQKFTCTFFLSPSFDAAQSREDRLSPLRRITASAHAAAARSSVKVPHAHNGASGVDVQPGAQLAKSVTFSRGTLASSSSEQPAQHAGEQRPKSAGASPDKYSSSQTAFEAFRAQMEADRAEVGIQLGKLGLAHQPASSSACAHAAYSGSEVAARQSTNPLLLPGPPAASGPLSSWSSTGEPTEGACQERDQLLEENQQLNERVETLTRQLDSTKKELKAMTKVQLELQARQPDVDRLVNAAVQREQAAQEERNRKALELLLKKDEQIKRLEVVNKSLNAEVAKLQAALQSTAAKMEAAHQSAAELAQINADLRVQRERDVAAAAAAQAALRSELAPAKSQLQDITALQDACDAHQQQASASEQQLKRMQVELDAAVAAKAAAEARSRQLADSVASFQQKPAAAAVDAALEGGEVDELRQQVLSLQSMLKALANGDITHFSAAAPTALFQRIKVLEDTNRRLEQALHADSSAKVSEYELQSVRSMLAERDEKLAQLQARLAMLGKQGVQSELYQEATLADLDHSGQASFMAEQVQALNQTIVGLQDKLAHLEAVHVLAQQSAMHSETELQHARRLLSEIEELAQKYAAEAEEAHSTSVKLNSRITELMLSEQAAKSAEASLRQELEAQAELHKRHVHSMELRLQQIELQLQESLAAGAALHSLLPENQPTPRQSANAMKGADMDGLRQAVEDAEGTIAILQAKLLKAEHMAQGYQHELDALRQSASTAQQDLHHQVRLANEDGSTRMQQLEDTVKRLGNRSELHSEVASLSTQLSNSKRQEKAMRANLELTEQQLAAQAQQSEQLEFQLRVVSRQLQELKELASMHGVQLRTSATQEILDHAQRPNTSGKLPHNRTDGGLDALANVSERAEKAEAEAEQWKLQAASLKAKVKRLEPVAAALTADSLCSTLHSELITLREQKEVLSLEAERLRLEVLQSAREVSAAQSSLANKELVFHEKAEASLRKSLQAVSSHAQEVAAANKRASDAVRRADQAESARHAAEEQARQATVRLAKLKAELENKQAEAEQLQEGASKKLAAAEAAAAASKREHEKAAQEAEERRIQASILLDTVETLQVGNANEAAQRVLALTAQLVTARTREALLERRASDLLAQLEGHGQDIAKLRQQLTRALQQAAEKEAALAAANSSLDSMQKTLDSLQEDVQHRNSLVLSASAELDEARHVLAATQAELNAAKAAMRSAEARHEEQLSRLRAEAAETARSAKQQAMLAAVHLGDDIIASHSARLAEGIEKLVVWTASSPASSSQPEVTVSLVQHMKALLLEADHRRVKAEVDARIAQSHAAGLAHEVSVLESALDRRTSEWEAAKLQHKLLEKSMKRHAAMAASHSEQLAALQANQISVLSKQLEDVSGKLVGAAATQAALTSELAAQRARGNSQQRRLTVAEAEAKELVARLAAAQLEAAGACEQDHSASATTATTQDRDAAIKQYFMDHLSQLCKTQDGKEQLQALAAEICALKITESQLLAKLAAANQRADASVLLNQALQQAVDSAVEELDACKLEDLTGSQSVLELSRLAAEVVVKTKEVHKLQEQLMLARQQLEAKELQLRMSEVQLPTPRDADSPALEHGGADTGHHAAEDRRASAALVQENTEYAQQVQQLRVLVAELKQAAKKESGRHAEEVQMLKEEAQKRAQAESDKATKAILQTHVPNSELLKAETQVVQLQAANERLQQEVHLLQQHMKELEVKVAGMQDVEDVTHAAMHKLEDTLARIEKVAVVSANAPGIRLRSSVPQGPRGTAGGSMRKGTAGADEAGEMSLASLSQELVKARLAEADAQRKLRVAARSEVDLRQRLLQRDERISQLKEELESKSRFSDDLKRRLSSSSTGSTARRAGFKPASSRPGRIAAPPESSAGNLAEEPLSPADCERRYLTAQVAQLRIELAKSDAEIEQLQGALAAAHATQTEPPDVQLLSKKAFRAEKLAEQLRVVHEHLHTAVDKAQQALPQLAYGCNGVAQGTGAVALYAQPQQQSRTVGEEACSLAQELLVIVDGLSQYTQESRVEVRNLQKEQAALDRSAAELKTHQQAAEQLLTDNKHLEARCLQLQAKLEQQPATMPRMVQDTTSAKTALGLCKMLQTSVQGIASVCRSLPPSQPAVQALQLELDSAQSLVASMAAELVACCQPLPSRSTPGIPKEEASFSFPAQAQAQPASDADSSRDALQKEALHQSQRAEKWKNHCKHMRKELAAVQAAFTALGSGSNGQSLEMAALHAAAAPLQQLQLETTLQTAKGHISALQQQLASTKAALGQEQQERATALASMRSALAGLATTGVTEERLKEELVKALEANARANADLAAARSKLESYAAHSVAQRTANHVTGMQSMAAVAQLQSALLESQRRLEDADRRMLDLQRSVSTRLDQLSSSLGDIGGGATVAVAASMDLLQQSADRLDQEVQQLQATHPGITKTQLQALLHKCRKYQQAVREQQAQVADVSAAADGQCQRIQAELEAAQRDAAACHEEVQELHQKVLDVQAFSEAERQRMVERHVAQLRDAEQRMEAERRELRQQANDRAEAAMAAGESRALMEASARVAEVEAQAAHTMAGLEEARARCAADLASLQLEFQRYQQQKAAEIAALEQRLVACLSLPFDDAVEQAAASRKSAPAGNRKGTAKNTKKRLRSAPSAAANRSLSIPTQVGSGLPYEETDPGRPLQSSQAWQAGPAGAVASAREAEDLGAVRREAHIEKLQRVRAEAAAEQLQEEVERLRARLKSSQQEVKQLQESSSSVVRLAAECAQGREDCERLEQELASCREALKAARADSTRRQRLLQQFQSRLGQEGTDQFPATVMEALRVKQEAAETQLQQAKAGLERKNAVIKELRKQVEDMKQQLQGTTGSGLQDKLAIAEARIAQLQASLQRKDSALRGAKDRAEQSQSLAAAAVATTAAAGQQAAAGVEAQEEAERQARLLTRLRTDVQRKDALLKQAQNELMRERERLQAAVEVAEEASKREARAGKQAANDVATLRGRAEQLVACLKEAVRLVLRCCEGMRSASAVAAVQSQQAAATHAQMSGVGADDIAQMVDMSAAEVADLLASCQPGAGATASAESLLHAGARAQALLLQLEVALAAGLSTKHARDTVPGRDSFARSSNSALGLQQQWDGGAADALLKSLDAGVRSCQAGLDAALQRLVWGR